MTFLTFYRFKILSIFVRYVSTETHFVQQYAILDNHIILTERNSEVSDAEWLKKLQDKCDSIHQYSFYIDDNL